MITRLEAIIDPISLALKADERKFPPIITTVIPKAKEASMLDLLWFLSIRSSLSKIYFSEGRGTYIESTSNLLL